MKPPGEWVTNDPKLFPTMQCHTRPYNESNSFLRERARREGLGEQLDVLHRSELVRQRACSCMVWGMLPDINRMVDLIAIASSFSLLPVSSTSSSTCVKLDSFFFCLLSTSSCLCFSSSWTSWSFFRVFFFSMQVSYYPFSFYICIYVGERIERSRKAGCCRERGWIMVYEYIIHNVNIEKLDGSIAYIICMYYVYIFECWLSR